MKTNSPRSRSGTALIITLMALMLLAIIAMGLTASMRVERVSARASLDKTRAALFSDYAGNQAVALLRSVSGETNRFWAARPGEGYVASQANNVLDTAVALNSGLGAATNAPDLNLGSLTTANERAVVSTNVALRLQWIYVYADGTLSTNAPAAYDATNKVTGRYAFWVDTENSRINWNTACQRAASAGALTPDAVDLTALTNVTAGLADQIHATVQTNRFFNTPEEISALYPDFESAKFTTTYLSHDPETTYWGAPRLVLTTQARLAGGRPFLDILQVPNSDPGPLGAVSATKLNTVLQTLVAYLGRADWPVGPAGADFGSKYFPGLPSPAAARQRVLYQLAMHIIDYVRAKESSAEIVQKIVGKVDASGKYEYTWYNDQNDVTSLSRQPCITEMGVYVQPAFNTTTQSWWGTYKLEVHLPGNYGLDSYDLSKLYVKVMWWHSWYYSGNIIGTAEASVVTAFNAANTLIDGTTPGTVLQKGHYAVISLPIDLRLVHTNPRPPNLFLKAYLCTNPGNVGTSYVEEAPMMTGYNYGGIGVIEYSPDATGVPEANITSVEVDDPRVNKHNSDWKRHTAGTAAAKGNTFGGVNSISSIGKAPLSLTAEQDTDGLGQITSESLYMPPPKGNPGNPDGMIHSIAELGRVFTGGLGQYTTGVPWRSVHLQPASRTGILPDWALLDLFSAPADPNNARNTASRLVTGGTNAAAGRINVNAAIAPFETGPSPALALNRTQPLEALLKGASLSQPYAQAATNIQLGTLAAKGQNYGTNSLAARPLSLRGQVAEILGVADGGESSEAGLRSFIDLTSTQANVFRVFTVGQSLLQTKDNTLKVMGERRDYRIVERVLPASGSVQFRTVYQRDITF